MADAEEIKTTFYLLNCVKDVVLLDENFKTTLRNLS